MRFLITLTALAAAACATAEPEPYNTPVAGPAGWERAAEVAVAEWSARLDVELPDPPTITYYDGCLVYPDAFMEQEWYSSCIRGRYFQAGEIHLRNDGGPGLDSLAHETLHWALHMTTGDPDGGHAGPAWLELWKVDAAILLDDEGES